MIHPRPYQLDVIKVFRDNLAKGITRQLCVLPTGTGKTLTALLLAKQMRGPILWLAHRDELIQQPIKALKTVWPEPSVGIVKASNDEWTRDFVFASVQTACKDKRLASLQRREWALVVLDEAHHGAAASWRKVVSGVGCLSSGSPPPLLGLTATPERLDSARLDDIFEVIAYQYHLRQAILDGYLVPPDIVLEPIKINLDGVHTRGGDFNPGELDLALLEGGIIDSITGSMMTHAAKLKSLVFTVSVKQAKLVADALKQKGIKAASLDGAMHLDERRYLLRKFASGEIQVLTNCAVLCLDEETEILTTEGWVGVDAITKDHYVANWDTDGSVFFEKPKEIVVRPRGANESMFVLKTRTRDIRVTGRHRMIYRRGSQAPWGKESVDDVAGRPFQLPTCGVAEPLALKANQEPRMDKRSFDRRVSANSYALRKNNGYGLADSRCEAKKRIAKRLSLRRSDPLDLTVAECQFIGFWIGDGSCCQLQSGGVEYTASQSKVYPRIIAWFDSVIERCGVDCLKKEQSYDGIDSVRWSFARGTGFGPQSRNGVFHLEPYLDKNGSVLLWGLNIDQLDALLEGFWYADGNQGKAVNGRPVNYVIANTNKRLLSTLQAIATVRGMTASVYANGKPREAHHAQLWALGVVAKTFHQMSNIKSHYMIQEERAPYRGERVWCVKTTTKNIITRRNGRVTVMGNTEGFDEPSIECIVMARPTQSKSLYIQCCGRGLRLSPGKTTCRIIDLVALSGRHSLVQAPVIFGAEMEEPEPKTQAQLFKQDPIEYWKKRLSTQVMGLESISRSDMRWIRGNAGELLLGVGNFGTVRLMPSDVLWRCDVIGNRETGTDLEPLAGSPIELELAQGIGEDYVRRCKAVTLARGGRWRDQPATPAQLEALRKWKVEPPDGLSKGQASEMLTAAAARTYEPATDKQLNYLRRLGVQIKNNMTKREAGRAISKAKEG